MRTKKIDKIIDNYLVNTAQMSLVEPIPRHRLKGLQKRLEGIRLFSEMNNRSGADIHLENREIVYLINVLKGIGVEDYGK